MKKLLLLLIVAILSTNICFAKVYQIPSRKQFEYKQRVENYIDQKYMEDFKKTEMIYAKAQKIYSNFRANKNIMKNNKSYIDLLESYGWDLGTLDFNLFSEIIDITKQYTKLKDIPATDSTAVIQNYIEPYLYKYNISNINKFKELDNYITIRYNNVTDWRDEINNYSYAYEKAKIKNFENRISKMKTTSIGYLPYWKQSGVYGGEQLRTNVIYISRFEVLQILDGGVLCETNLNVPQIMYLQTPNYDKLMHGDVLTPYLPIKYTGRFYTYRNFYGEVLSVPIFSEVSLTTYNKQFKLPQIAEPFYFEEKPIFENNAPVINSVTIVNMKYPHRCYTTYSTK